MPRLKLVANLALQKVTKQFYNAKTQLSFMHNGSLSFIPPGERKKIKHLILVPHVIVVGMNEPSAWVFLYKICATCPDIRSVF